MVTDDALRKHRISQDKAPSPFAVLFLLMVVGFLVWVLVTA
jgi:hypothetical protein